MARTSEAAVPLGFGGGAAGSLRSAAFDRAERHSRRVRRLKFVLPMLALALVGGSVAYYYASKPSALPVASVDGASFAEGKLVMSNPKLEGFTSAGKPYSMTAVRAVQSLDMDGVITLEGINARMPVDQGSTARVEAAAGVYDRTANTMKLDSDITVTTTDGVVAKLRSAFLDIGKGRLDSREPVEIQMRNSRVTAQSMSMLENGKVLVFERNVRMNIVPEKTGDAPGLNGATDNAAGQQTGADAVGPTGADSASN